jgi:glycosyltransferase involved in cell wall biosynthesis
MISVLIPTFNQESFVQQTIVSAINQTFKDIEILVGDDASTDATVNVVKKLAKQDERIKLFMWKKNEGGLKNIDKLLQHASGELLVILEGDDYWINDKYLETASQILNNQKDISFVGSRFYKGTLDKKAISKFYGNVSASILSLGNFIQLGTVVFRRKIISRIDPTYIDLPLGDYPLFMQLLQHGSAKIIKEPSFFYRVHAAGIWSTQSDIYQIDKTLETINVMQRTLRSTYLFNFQINYLLAKKIISLKNLRIFNFIVILKGIIAALVIKINQLFFLRRL